MGNNDNSGFLLLVILCVLFPPLLGFIILLFIGAGVQAVLLGLWEDATEHPLRGMGIAYGFTWFAMVVLALLHVPMWIEVNIARVIIAETLAFGIAAVVILIRRRKSNVAETPVPVSEPEPLPDNVIPFERHPDSR